WIQGVRLGGARLVQKPVPFHCRKPLGLGQLLWVLRAADLFVNRQALRVPPLHVEGEVRNDQAIDTLGVSGREPREAATDGSGVLKRPSEAGASGRRRGAPVSMRVVALSANGGRAGRHPAVAMR